MSHCSFCQKIENINESFSLSEVNICSECAKILNNKTLVFYIYGSGVSICYINGWKYKENFWIHDLIKVINTSKTFSGAKALALTRNAEENYKKIGFPSQLNDYKEDDFE